SSQIIAVNLHGERTFDSAYSFFKIVGNGLRKIPEDTRNFLQFAVHRFNKQFLVLMEHWPPFFFREQIDEILGVEEASRVRAIIGTPHLIDDLGHLGERAEDLPSSFGDAGSFSRS